jgi:hypothetical protein
VTADNPKFIAAFCQQVFSAFVTSAWDPYRCPDQKVASSTETRACCYRLKIVQCRIAVNRRPFHG